MPMAFEADLAGRRDSWADVIACVESDATPYTSMIDKRTKPAQVTHNWQVKAYPVTGHRGVLDGMDATSFDSTPREELSVRAQKTWRKPGVTDFADEAEIQGLKGGEMAEQLADAIVTVKRQIEKRCLSAEDTCADNATTRGNETRGVFSWLANQAQTNLPVPDGFRTPTAQRYTSTLALFTEVELSALCRASFKQRKGPSAMHGFLGIDLKAAFSNFSKYVDTVANKTAIRTFNQDANSKAVITTVDRLVMDTGTIDLHPSAFLYTDADTGADTLYTHRSGVILDMSMMGLAYSRMPRTVKLQYQGGGQKAIVDAIFLHMCDNPLGHMAIVISADS
jgi:hypothetical protein